MKINYRYYNIYSYSIKDIDFIKIYVFHINPKKVQMLYYPIDIMMIFYIQMN